MCWGVIPWDSHRFGPTPVPAPSAQEPNSFGRLPPSETKPESVVILRSFWGKGHLTIHWVLELPKLSECFHVVKPRIFSPQKMVKPTGSQQEREQKTLLWPFWIPLGMVYYWVYHINCSDRPQFQPFPQEWGALESDGIWWELPRCWGSWRMWCSFSLLGRNIWRFHYDLGVPPNHPKENDQNDHVIYIYRSF